MQRHKPMSNEIYQYLLNSSSRESAIQAKLRETTHAQLEFSAMMTSPEQAQFLNFLVGLIGAEHAIEVGVFTGYGSLAIALALPDNGELIACDSNVEWTSLGKPYWEQAGVADKINLKIGPALDTLQDLLRNNRQNEFDFIFIDADKIHYLDYYECGLKLIRQGGLIVFDNMLWVGDQVVLERKSPATKAIYQLTEFIRTDERVNMSLVPIGEGMLLVRKK